MDVLSFITNLGFSFKNIYRSWFTTLLGAIFIIAGLASQFYFFKEAGWAMNILPIVLGIMLLFAGEKVHFLDRFPAIIFKDKGTIMGAFTLRKNHVGKLIASYGLALEEVVQDEGESAESFLNRFYELVKQVK